MGIPPGPRKLQYKVAAKVLFRQAQFVSPTVEFTLQAFFSSLFLCTIFFSGTFACVFFFFFFVFFSPPSHHSSNGPSLMSAALAEYLHQQRDEHKGSAAGHHLSEQTC